MHAVVFEVADRRFAIPTSVVEHVVPWVAIESIPGAPDIVEGVVNVRGRLAAVWGLRRRFALPERPATLWDHLIIAWAGPRLVAVHVDRATDVVEIPPEVIKPVATVTEAAPGIGGLATLSNGVLLVHDPAAFLTAAESDALDRAVRRATGGAERRP